MNTSTKAMKAGFPSKERPNSEKDAKYVQAWLRAIYSKHRSCILGPGGVDANIGQVANIWNNFRMTDQTRRWSRGLNDVAEYKKVFAMNSPEANTILTQRAMKWNSPMDHVPYMDRLRNIFTNRDTSLIVNILNKAAQDAHLDEQMRLLAKAVMASDPELKAAAQGMGIDIAPPANEPQTPSEWEMYQRMGAKPAIAVTIRKAINALKALVKYHRTVRPFLADSLIDDGLAVLVSLVNNRGVPEPMVVRYENCLIPETSDNWRDPPWFAIRVFMTPSEIFSRMGRECTPQIRERVNRMAQASSNLQIPVPLINGVTTPNRTEDGIEVLVGWFKDYNTLDVATRKSDGIARKYEASMDPSEYEVERTQYEVVYEGMWIIGTEEPDDGIVDHGADRGAIYWGCRLSYSQPRMRDALWRTRLPVVITSYGMYNMCVQSIASRMKLAYDPVVMASLELKALILRIVPPYIAIEGEWLDKVTGVDGTGQRKRGDLIRTLLQSGVLEVNSRDPDDYTDTGERGFKEGIRVDGGFIPEFERLAKLIEFEMGRFERVAGFNEANNGGTMDERQPVRNAQIMATSQAKALKPITDCMDAAEADLAEVMYMQLQCVLASGGEIEWLGPFLGDATARVIQLTADTDPGTVGMEMRQMSTEEERGRFQEMLSTAATNGEITSDDVYFVGDMEDKNEASEWLRKRRETRAQQKQAETMQAIEAQNQGNQQAAQITQEAMLAKVQAESQARMAEIQMKGELDLQRMQLQNQFELQKLQMTLESTMGREFEKLSAKMEETLAKLASQERIASGSDDTKVLVSNQQAATQVEVAEMTTEAQKEAAKSRPKPK